MLYSVTDVYGQSDSATVSITVNSVNDVPFAADVNVSAVKNTALAMDVLAGASVVQRVFDRDPDGEPQDGVGVLAGLLT